MYLLHFVILLGGSGYSLIPYINFTKRPAAIALLTEKRNWSHNDGFDQDWLAVRNNGLFSHHVTHVFNVSVKNKKVLMKPKKQILELGTHVTSVNTQPLSSNK